MITLKYQDVLKIEKIAKDMINLGNSKLFDDGKYLLSLIGKDENLTFQKAIVHADGRNMGVVGTHTGYGDYHVGDILHFDNYRKAMVVSDDGEYFAYGWRGLKLSELESTRKDLKIMYPYDFSQDNTTLVNQPLYIKYIVE